MSDLPGGSGDMLSRYQLLTGLGGARQSLQKVQRRLDHELGADAPHNNRGLGRVN